MIHQLVAQQKKKKKKKKAETKTVKGEPKPQNL